MKIKLSRLAMLLCGAAVFAPIFGCTDAKGPAPGSAPTAGPGTPSGAAAKPPTKFTLAWSEYPSWSIFGVADEVGLIDGKAGAMGSIEKKYNIDIELLLASYDQCITLYGNSQADAVCITNIDILGAAGSRSSVAIMPTSTSAGADACITAGIDTVDGLQGKTTRGLEKSVSQFCFDRCLEKLGKKPADFPFSQMDPEQAAQAFQGKDASIPSIMVWNPFVMQSIRSRSDAKVLFSSELIPEEIIDMVVVGRDSLDKPSGKEFANALLEMFYTMNQRMTDPKTSDATLVGIGARFARLELADMKTVVKQTRFYSDPKDAIRLFGSETFQKETMPIVSKFCVQYGLTPTAVDVSFGTGKGVIDFDTSYMKAYVDGLGKTTSSP